MSPQMEKVLGIWLIEFSPGRAVVGLKDEGDANLGAVARRVYKLMGNTWTRHDLQTHCARMLPN